MIKNINDIKDSVIFMTGVTGFVGQSVLSEILRNYNYFKCKKIFVLIRPSKDET